MKNIILIGAVAAVLSANSSYALENATGIISDVDVKTGDFMLTTGENFRIDNPTKLYGFVPGDKVVVAFLDQGNAALARSVAKIRIDNSRYGSSGMAGFGYSSSNEGGNGGNGGGGAGGSGGPITAGR
jgi:hypothetical protein